LDFFNWELVASLDEEGDNEDDGHGDEEDDGHGEALFGNAATPSNVVNQEVQPTNLTEEEAIQMVIAQSELGQLS
jgi:hypothetical protein